MAKREERCETCRFWAVGEYPDDVNKLEEECRRYPPTPRHPDSDSYRVPLTTAEYWCGEWQAAPPVTPRDV